MFATDAWRTIRDNRGWTDFFVSGDEFLAFLVQQEQEMGELLRELGLLN